jgi:hypothetical protein
MADCDYSDQGKIDWLLFGLNRELLNALSTQPTTSWNWARPSGTSVRLEPPANLGASNPPYQHPELLLPTCLGLRTPPQEIRWILMRPVKRNANVAGPSAYVFTAASPTTRPAIVLAKGRRVRVFKSRRKTNPP